MPLRHCRSGELRAIKIHYEDIGTGKPIVLIHGFPLSGRSWRSSSPPCCRADTGSSPTTAGFGYSSQPSFGYDYDTFAQDLHLLITELDLRDVILGGMSMGGGEVARYSAPTDPSGSARR